MGKRFKTLLIFFQKRSFLVFLLLSAILWYVNKLSFRYSTAVTIPIELVFDYNADVWVEHPLLEVRCQVDGIGSKLLQYKMGAISRLRIPISSLELQRASGAPDEDMYRISDVSMREAISTTQKEFSIIHIIDTISWVVVSKIDTAELPVASDIKIACAKGYMQIGQTRLSPEVVMVRAPRTILQHLHVINTQTLDFEGLRHSIQGSVALVLPVGVTVANESVRYVADVAKYTELEFNLPLVGRNVADSLILFTVPSKVTLRARVPLSSFIRTSDFAPVAYIDCSSERGINSNQLPVQLDSIPQGAQITSIMPRFVEPFFRVK